MLVVRHVHGLVFRQHGGKVLEQADDGKTHGRTLLVVERHVEAYAVADADAHLGGDAGGDEHAVRLRREAVHQLPERLNGIVAAKVGDLGETGAIHRQQATGGKGAALGQRGAILAHGRGGPHPRDCLVLADGDRDESVLSGKGAARFALQSGAEGQIGANLVAPPIDEPDVGAVGQRGIEHTDAQAQQQHVHRCAVAPPLAPQMDAAQVRLHGAEQAARPGHGADEHHEYLGQQ